ncbi:hypothetical protein MHYP_G00289910 [Metynnis hypsauchen]
MEESGTERVLDQDPRGGGPSSQELSVFTMVRRWSKQSSLPMGSSLTAGPECFIPPPFPLACITRSPPGSAEVYS